MITALSLLEQGPQQSKWSGITQRIIRERQVSGIEFIQNSATGRVERAKLRSRR
jgi:hypothetical protein